MAVDDHRSPAVVAFRPCVFCPVAAVVQRALHRAVPMFHPRSFHSSIHACAYGAGLK